MKLCRQNHLSIPEQPHTFKQQLHRYIAIRKILSPHTYYSTDNFPSSSVQGGPENSTIYTQPNGPPTPPRYTRKINYCWRMRVTGVKNSEPVIYTRTFFSILLIFFFFFYQSASPLFFSPHALYATSRTLYIVRALIDRLSKQSEISGPIVSVGV